MNGRGVATVRALAALSLTVALVVGVPYLLVTLAGNPLPTNVPTLDEIRILLTQNGQGFTNFLIGSLALIIWFIWLQLMVALVVEVVATVRQRETQKLRTAPGIQALAARLVATVALATALAAGPLLAPAIGALDLGDQPLAQAKAHAVDIASSAILMPSIRQPLGASTVTSAKDAPGQVASTALVLDEQTELWDLAEAAYGDGVSWKLIAQANAGSQDATGASITGATEVVAPGTELVLPGAVNAAALSAFGQVAVTAEPANPDAELTSAAFRASGLSLNRRSAQIDPQRNGIHKVELGESMWTVSQEQVEESLDRPATDAEVAEYWVEVVAANQDVPSGNVDLIYPGETLALPGKGMAPITVADALDPVEPGQTPAEPAEPAHASNPEESIADVLANLPPGLEQGWSNPTAEVGIDDVVTGTTDSSIVEPADSPANSFADSVDDNRSALTPAIGLAGLGAAMLSAGILGAVRRRRDLQRRTRPQGAMARQSSTEAAAFEAALAYAADEVIESKNGAGWKMLSIDAVAAMRSSGPVYIHAEESGRLRAIAITPTGPLDSGELDVEETVEVVRKRVAPADSAEAADAQESEATAVVMQTAEASDEAPCSVVPTSLLIGTNVETNEAVLLDLESAGRVELRGDHGAVRRFARTAVLDLGVSGRAEDLCVIAVGVGDELDALERVRAVDSLGKALEEVLRSGHTVPGVTTPVVVISTLPGGSASETVDALTALGASIVAPEIDGSVSISLQERHAVLSPGGTRVELVALGDSDYRSAAELLKVTSPQALALVDETIRIEGVIDVTPDVACSVEAGPIEVKVLGPVEVVGASSFSSLKAVDVVAYLAFHRNGVDADQIKAWVWPTFEPPTNKALANVLSRARTGLGADENGVPYLSRAGVDKTYRLSEEVTTDFDRFRAITELADASPDQVQALARLREAIELIRGVPFSGGAASSFAWADNHVRAQVEYTIDEAVHRAADLALELGDLKSARWAALKGLELVPGCEQCFRRRFLVASASSNRSELRRAMADLERSAAADLGEPEAIDCISGDLLDLFHELDQALVSGVS